MTTERVSRSLPAPPVAAGGSPLLGHAWTFLHDPLRLVESLGASGDLVRVRIGPKSIYAVTDPGLVEELLLRHGSSLAVGGPFWERLQAVLGSGVATSNGADHRRQRRMIQPPFRHERVADYLRVMNDEARVLADRWDPGQEIDLADELFSTVVRIVSRSLLQVPVMERRLEEFGAALHAVFAGLYRRMVVPLGWWYRIPTPSHRRFDHALAALHRITDEVIEARRRSGEEHDDLLGVLLAARDDQGRPLPHQEIHDNVLSIIVGGSETVASTLSWTFFLLAEHPEHERRLHKEVDALSEDLIRPEALPYARNLIYEAMRLRPAAWIFTRRTKDDIEVNGYRIPAGSDVIYSTYALQRDGRSFDRALDFDPDRWLPERAENVSKAAMMPFGIGNRKCPGDHFSVAETAIILAAVTARWRLRPTPATDTSTSIDITLRPARPLMRVEPRQKTKASALEMR
jgi:epi-isozizaene 5-monooxygenase